MKDWLLPLATGDCYLRKLKKMVSTTQKISFNYLKYGPSLKISFQLYQWQFPLRGETLNKRKRFLLAKQSVSTSRNEGLRFKKNTFPLDEEKSYYCQESLRNGEKKWLPLARKLISPSQNKLLLTGIFCKNWIPSNYNNGFR